MKPGAMLINAAQRPDRRHRQPVEDTGEQASGRRSDRCLPGGAQIESRRVSVTAAGVRQRDI